MTDRTSQSAAEVERAAEQARTDLSATLDQLKDNLQPKQLAGEAWAATRARTPDWVTRTASFISSPSGLGLIGATAASIGVTVLKHQQRRSRRFIR